MIYVQISKQHEWTWSNGLKCMDVPLMNELQCLKNLNVLKTNQEPKNQCTNASMNPRINDQWLMILTTP